MTKHKAIKPAVFFLAIAMASTSYAAPPAFIDPEATTVTDLVVVAPAKGPAWWKVSKGGSVVWILGLPPAKTPRGMKWDDRTLQRRLKGAKLMLAPAAGEPGGFGEKKVPCL